MIVDTSAVRAILFGEPEAVEFTELLSGTDRNFMSALNWLEAGMVVESEWGAQGTAQMHALMEKGQIDVVAFDASLAEIALDAWRRYGKGRHPAGLNFGDCAAYALAKLTRRPLLFKGGDFALTDIVPAAE